MTERMDGETQRLTGPVKVAPELPAGTSLNSAAGPRFSGAEESAIKKAARRLMPLLIFIYILSYIDRINLGFAALTMGADIGLTATMIGVANTAFYIMYALFEVPSNMALARFGARVWIPRIMVTWGLATVGMMFVEGSTSLYVMRAILGIAEAGLLPGILFYIGTWFPERRRAEMNSLFLLSVPGALFIGAPLSGLILGMNGILGLHGWQWLFLITGLAPILFGIAVYIVLPESPKSARWLEEPEKQALIARLQAEDAAKRKVPQSEKSHWAWNEVWNIPTVTFGVVYFALISSNNMVGTWVPLILNDVFRGEESVLVISVASALPALAAMIGMYLTGKYSDKRQDRIRPLVGGMLMAACGWLLCASPVLPAFRVLGLMMSFTGVFCAMVVFWVIVTHVLSREGQAAGIALITTIGVTASIVNSPLIGYLRDWSGSYRISMWYEATVLTIGLLLVLLFVIPRFRATKATI